MKEKRPVFKGIVDKKLNPFSRPSWCREGKPEGYGRKMSKKRMLDFQKILDKGGKISDIKEPNSEEYAAFQAIRWAYAIIKLVPTEKWNENRPIINIESRSESKNEIQRSYIKRKTVKKPNFVINESDLIESLRNFDLHYSIQKYLNKDNLINKTANEIYKSYTFGNSIARAFRNEYHPSQQYKNWTETTCIDEILIKLNNISNQNNYDVFLFQMANSLVESWESKTDKGADSRMNIGISLKIVNLLMKHLTFVHLRSNSKLISYLHVPWDKFTLRLLTDIWVGKPRINNSSSQGFVNNKKQYLELHSFITNIVRQAGVDRIVYELWAYDYKH